MRNTVIQPFSDICRRAMLLIAMALLAVGCSKASTEGPGGGNDSGDGKVPVMIAFSTDGPLHAAVQDNVRAVANTSSTDETAVRELWVLQYDMDTPGGDLQSKQHITNIFQVGTKVYATVPLIPMVNTRIVVIANDPGMITDEAPAIGSTISELDAFSFAVTSLTGAGIPADDSEVLPMRGESGDMELEVQRQDPVEIPLYRLVSKVTFTLNNLCTEGSPSLELTSVQLCNAPVTGSYTRIIEATHSAVYYPGAATSNFRDYTPLKEGIDGIKSEFLWYTTPNARGIGTATKPADKNASTAPVGQGPYCSYIFVRGIIHRADGSTEDLAYRIFLGRNSTSDYNLWANEACNVSLYINSLPDDPSEDTGYNGFTVEINETDGTHDNNGGWGPPSTGTDGGIEIEDPDGTHGGSIGGWSEAS